MILLRVSFLNPFNFSNTLPPHRQRWRDNRKSRLLVRYEASAWRTGAYLVSFLHVPKAVHDVVVLLMLYTKSANVLHKKWHCKNEKKPNFDKSIIDIYLCYIKFRYFKNNYSYKTCHCTTVYLKSY